MTFPTSITIMVVTLNEARHIARLKGAIDALDRPEGFRIDTILIDGGSTDGTVEAAADAGFTRVIERPGGSIPVCRNAGIQAAQSDWMAFIDGDCELSSSWLTAILPFMQTDEPAVYGWPVKPPDPGTWVQRTWYIHWSCKNPHREDFEGREVVRRDAFRLITTRNMIFNRRAAHRLEGFDEALPTGEDTDFVFRAYAENMRVLAIPNLRVIHHGEPDTLNAFYRQQRWHANRSAYKKIAAKSGGRYGANAPLYTLVFGITFLIGLLSLAAGLSSGQRFFLIGLLPWPAVFTLPALRTAVRAKKMSALPALMLLYMVYGFGRLVDLIGLSRLKKSWKSRGP